MRKPYLFEAALAIVLIMVAAGLYIAVAASPATVSGWEFQGSGTVQYMTVGQNDTLFAFRGDGIYAIDQTGNLIWSFEKPQEWKIINSWVRPAYAADSQANTAGSYPVTATAGGYLYIFALQDQTLEDLKLQSYQSHSTYITINASVLAISPQGKLVWELPQQVKVSVSDFLSLTDIRDFKLTQNVALRTDGDRLYVFNDGVETVVDHDGTVLFTIDDVARPASIDEKGNIYLLKNPSSQAATSVQVVAYNASGQMTWEREVQGTVASQYVADDLWSEYNCMPMYQNSTLYLPMTNGIIALDTRTPGNTSWWKYLPPGTYAMFDLMPLDSRGNVYMKQLNPGSTTTNIYVIGPDGMIRTRPWQYTSTYGTMIHTAARDGIVYNVDKTSFGYLPDINSLGTETITANSVWNGTVLWRYTIPVSDRRTVTLNETNIDAIFSGENGAGSAIKIAGDYYSLYSSPAAGSDLTNVPLTPIGWPEISIHPGADIVYVSFRSTTYEAPIILNRSQATFSSGIYALGADGRPLWQKQLSLPVTSTAANNSTIYYSTSNGKIFGTSVSQVVAVLALLGSLAIFFKFFVFGTVSRARDRLDKNDNRNMVLTFIAANPGVTAVDVARDLHLNVGTVRYHLLILAINHKIVEHKDDKYLRYFTNSNSYSMEERAVVSLMKREPMWRVLNALAEKPGLSNVEISRELNISTGAASRHMNELLARGIIDKAPQGDRGFAYTIKEEYRQYVTRMMERL